MILSSSCTPQGGQMKFMLLSVNLLIIQLFIIIAETPERSNPGGGRLLFVCSCRGSKCESGVWWGHSGWQWLSAGGGSHMEPGMRHRDQACHLPSIWSLLTIWLRSHPIQSLSDTIRKLSFFAKLLKWNSGNRVFNTRAFTDHSNCYANHNKLGIISMST